MAGDAVPNGNGLKGPWWVQLVQTVGPTACIAGFLTYMLAAQVTPAIEAIKGYMAEHIQQMQMLSDSIAAQAQVQKQQWEDLKAVIQQEHRDREKALGVAEQTCVNSAKSPYQTQQCVQRRNGDSDDP